jgi:apolipoprotein N-acyltransferase
VRRMTREGADFFAVPSMDPIVWGPVQRLQHSALFRIRAAENGRAMVVCATSGVTQNIGPGGDQVAMLAPLKRGVLTGVIPLRKGLTFYTRCGWVFPWIALAGGILFLLQALWREHGARVAA